jgi:hypothetical protein
MNLSSPARRVWRGASRLGQRLMDTVTRPFWFKRVDGPEVPAGPAEVRLFAVVRDEAMRLPYFLDYYRSKGVDRFFVVDNASSDGTLPYLLSQKDVHVFRTGRSYGHADCGMDWIRHLLRRFGNGRWCVVADADEFLTYPHVETMSLKALVRYMDSVRATGLISIMLDMYSAGPIRDAHYRAGQDPLDVCRYFDPASHEFHVVWTDPVTEDKGTSYRGGVRKRVFGFSPTLNKIMFFKYHPGVDARLGCHYVFGLKFPDISGAILHFKFTAEFPQRAEREAERKEHWDEASEYRRYLDAMQSSPDLTLRDANSRELTGNGQLVWLGIMRTSDAFERFAGDAARNA